MSYPITLQRIIATTTTAIKQIKVISNLSVYTCRAKYRKYFWLLFKTDLVSLTVFSIRANCSIWESKAFEVSSKSTLPSFTFSKTALNVSAPIQKIYSDFKKINIFFKKKIALIFFLFPFFY